MEESTRRRKRGQGHKGRPHRRCPEEGGEGIVKRGWGGELGGYSNSSSVSVGVNANAGASSGNRRHRRSTGRS